MAEAQRIQPPPEVPAPTMQTALAELEGVLARANAVQVTNDDEYAAAVMVCQKIATMKSQREEERLAITRKMDAAKNAVMDFFATTFTTPLKKVDDVIRGKLKAYDAEQKRIAEERRRQVEAEAARVRAETERKAREERERAEAKARAEREEADRQRREEERQRAEAEEARKRGDIEAARAKEVAAAQSAAAARKSEQKAERIAETGEAKAQALTERAAAIVPVVIDAGPVRVPGKAKRTIWKHRVVDATKVDRRFLCLDEKKIGDTVKALKKDAVEVVGGIEVWEEEDLTIRKEKA